MFCSLYVIPVHNCFVPARFLKRFNEIENPRRCLSAGGIKVAPPMWLNSSRLWKFEGRWIKESIERGTLVKNICCYCGPNAREMETARERDLSNCAPNGIACLSTSGCFPVEIFSTDKMLDTACNCWAVSNLFIFYSCYFYFLARALRALLKNFIFADLIICFWVVLF